MFFACVSICYLVVKTSFFVKYKWRLLMRTVWIIRAVDIKLAIALLTISSSSLYFIVLSSVVVIHEGIGITLYIYLQLCTTVHWTSFVTYTTPSLISVLHLLSLAAFLPLHAWPLANQCTFNFRLRLTTMMASSPLLLSFHNTATLAIC